MLYLVLFVLLLGLILAPQLWARHILRKYSAPRSDLPGTGGELVEHLRKKFALADLQLESTPTGDHYDPQTRTVRLTEQNLNGRSLTAVAVASHEFGHALQHATDYRPLLARTGMVRLAGHAEKAAGIALMVLPLLALAPGGGRLAPLLIVVVLSGMAGAALVHLITLPVELDASFGRALPLLQEGDYVASGDLTAVRRILLACALTYLAASLAGLLNVWRWLKFLRR
jgi:hypothetical protein